MAAIAIERAELTNLLASNVVDFLDLGCGVGRSCEYVRKSTGLRVAVSLDSDPAKIAECRKVNDLSFVFDVLDLPRSIGTVSAAFMIHFLEHLPGEAAAHEVIHSALLASRDFVLIRQPFFDHDEELAGLGLKTYWSDWTGHKSPMKTSFFASLVKSCDPLVQRVRIFGIDRIGDSSHAAVLPLAAPPDQHEYLALHGVKSEVSFRGDCFREVLVLLERQPHVEIGAVGISKMLAGLKDRAELLLDVSAGGSRRAHAKRAAPETTLGIG